MHENGRDSRYARDFLHFDGNAQTLRLLAGLQLVSDPYGVNLTCGTLSATCKYLPQSHQLDLNRHSHSKLGHLASENVLVEKWREITGTGNARHPIALLVEAADDITYATVDIEEGIH